MKNKVASYIVNISIKLSIGGLIKPYALVSFSHLLSFDSKYIL